MLALSASALLAAPDALPQEISEDAVKAAFLYRFADYVEWPQPARRSEFVIAVFGASGVHAELRRLLPRVTVQSRPARVVSIERPEQLDAAWLLYVGTDRTRDAGPLMVAAAARPVLVVTDAGDGLDRGAAINFVRVGARIRFEVSLDAAARSGLHVKSDLLSVAVRVTAARKEEGS